MPYGLRTDERRWCDERLRSSGLEPGAGDPARRGSVSTPAQERLKCGAQITLVSGLMVVLMAAHGLDHRPAVLLALAAGLGTGLHLGRVELVALGRARLARLGA